MYINTHTYYSFKYGTMSPDELIDEALKHNVRQLALTDINSTSGCLYYARKAQELGLRPILGVDFRKGDEALFVAIAESNSGFEQINHLLSDVLSKKREMPLEAPEMKEVIIVYPLHNVPSRSLRPDEYVGISQDELFGYRLKKANEYPKEKCVALNTVTFRNKRDYNTHCLLRAIDQNILLSKLDRSKQGKTHHSFYEPQEMSALFSGSEFLLDQASRLLSRCELHFSFNDKNNTQNKKTFTQSRELDYHLLRSLAEDGLFYRFGRSVSKEVKERLEKELQVIRDCNFVPYFLINHSIVNYARQNGYFYVGRGSGANSLVAYLLKITNVDPIELDLYFERFINPSRKSPPDFDIDFSWKDRNDVTNFIFKTFPNTALLGAFVTFQQNSVVRELGKVLGIPGDEIKTIQRCRDPRSLDQIAKLCLMYSQYIHGLPNHLSIHSSGIIITEKPIQHFSATSLPPKGFPTCHFDMHIAEDAGIYKYDILGQRGLGKIKDALQVIKVNQPEAEDIDIDDVKRFKQDEKVKEILRTGRSIGCFYVESPAMRALMKKLEVDDYKGLVAASSIIRPGVSQSGMMQEYIKRHRNPNQRAAIHPVLGEILHETYGVMVYQEDVLKVAHFFAGLDLEESDKLRRGMSWKFRERPEFQEVKIKFFRNCDQKGYDRKLSTEIWRQIESFANYAFAKGHSASYAVESYQSLFLKAYYPLEYMVATVNNFGGFYRTEHYLQEARLLGAKILPPCVNEAVMLTTIKGKDIMLGFQHVKSLEQKTVRDIILARSSGGPYTSLEDFVNRVPVSLEMLTILIRVNAFGFTGKSKGTLLWEAHFMLGDKKQSKPIPELFRDRYQSNPEVPSLEEIPYEDSYDEIEYLGFPLSSPFDLIDQNELLDTQCASDFPNYENKIVTVVGYLVHVKRTKTKGRIEQEMSFGTFMDKEGQFLDSVHFPESHKRYRFKGKGIYKVKGKVTSDYGHLSLEMSEMEKLAYTKLIVKP
ncbi:DNA polymerase III subunit alpha [bacterium]|nr:DNA polymerase III subunit alpha [bacterium]